MDEGATPEHSVYQFLSEDLLSESWHSMDSHSLSSLQQLALYASSWRVSTAVLLAFRATTLTLLLGSGFGVGWTVDASWHHGNPPPVYLTNWGLVSVTCYFMCATCLSVLFLFRRKHGFTTASSWLGIGPSRRLGFVLTGAQIVFEICLILEPLVAVGFWALIYPSAQSCAFPSCYTVHVAAALCVAVDATLNHLQLQLQNLVFVLGYTALWLVTQIAWVYTGHDPDYNVLTLRDSQSIYLCVGGFLGQGLLYFTLRWLLAKKPRPPF